MIHLKSKEADFDKMEMAMLVRPDSDGLKNDTQLYQRVRENGGATIVKFINPFVLDNKETTLTPDEFEANWRGD